MLGEKETRGWSNAAARRSNQEDIFRDMTMQGGDVNLTAFNGFSHMAPRYSWELIRAGSFRIDGGSTFGVIPKVVWGKRVPVDEQNRIALSHNCLLLERLPHDMNRAENAGNDRPHRVLIEAGSGDKLDAKTRGLYAMNDESIATALEGAGISCADIDDVAVTHLHFDHCGGLTRWARPGETPDWHPTGRDPAKPGVKLTFPNATISVQRREWDDALSNRSHMTRAYRRENLEPLRDWVKLLDAPLPFPEDSLPDLDQSPAVPLSRRTLEILPGISVFRVPGHTWGQQAVCFKDERGRTVVFTPDVIPTLNHVGAFYNMAYDVEPYMSTITRRWFLEEAVNGNWLLVLDHETGNPVCRVKPDGKGWYELVAEEVTSCQQTW